MILNSNLINENVILLFSQKPNTASLINEIPFQTHSTTNNPSGPLVLQSSKQSTQSTNNNVVSTTFHVALN